LERCRDQITDTLTFTTRIILTITRANRIARRNTMTDILRPMCWKFGLLGVITAICYLGISCQCLVVTSPSCRHRWGIGPERYTEQPGRISLRWVIRQCFLAKTGIQFYCEIVNDISLDPNTLYPVVLPPPPALRPESLVLRQSPKSGLPLTLPR
jgi:hypothetical protein